MLPQKLFDSLCKCISVLWIYVIVPCCILAASVGIVQKSNDNGRDASEITITHTEVLKAEESRVNNVFWIREGCAVPSCRNFISYSLDTKVLHYSGSVQDEANMKLVADVGPKVLEGALALVTYREEHLSLEEGQQALNEVSHSLNLLKSANWTFHIVGGYTPAFVYSFLPRHIWISRSVIEHVGGRRDEVAFVLAHEISHSLLAHALRDAATIKAHLSLHAFMLTFVPWSYKPAVWLSVHVLDVFRQSLVSKESELQADAMGLEIAAFACFDTRLAANFFRSTEPYAPTISITHPSHSDRYKRLVEVVADSSELIAHARQECVAFHQDSCKFQ